MVRAVFVLSAIPRESYSGVQEEEASHRATAAPRLGVPLGLGMWARLFWAVFMGEHPEAQAMLFA